MAVDPDAVLKQFHKLLAEGDHAGAERVVGAAIPHADDAATLALLYSCLAQSRLDEEDKEGALSWRLKAEEADPGQPSHRVSTAWVLWLWFRDEKGARGKIDEALTLELEPGLAFHEAEQLRGEIELAKGDSDLAVRHLHRSLDLEDLRVLPVGPSLVLAEHLAEQGRHLESVRTYLARVEQWATDEKRDDVKAAVRVAKRKLLDALKARSKTLTDI